MEQISDLDCPWTIPNGSGNRARTYVRRGFPSQKIASELNISGDTVCIAPEANNID